MAKRFVAVLEAGTSSARCFLFDDEAHLVASRSTAWTYSDRDDASSLAREFDPGQVWESFCRLTQAVLADDAASSGQVGAVAVTSQRQGLAFLDSEGHELYLGPNIDLRAVFEGGVIDEDMGDRVYATTGHTPSFLLAPAKLRWFHLNRPDTYARISTVLGLADWLVFRLSGALVSEPSLACETGLLDVRGRGWCSDLLADLGVGDNGHVPLVRAGTVAGSIGRQAARETGLPDGIPVVVSGADTHCGLLALGVTEDRQVGVVAGWSVPLVMAKARPVFSPQARTWTGCHVLEKRWTLEGSSGDAGNSYRWLAETLWGDGHPPYDEMDTLAGRAPAGSHEALAFLGPSRMDMSNVGVRAGGMLFPVPIVANPLARGDLVRASLEGIAYAVRSNLEQVEGLVGGPAIDLAVGGGMIQTSSWVHILANVIGRPLSVSPTPQASALGAYLCASSALGMFASLQEAANSARTRLTVIEPEPALASQYADHYQRWLEVSAMLEQTSL